MKNSQNGVIMVEFLNFIKNNYISKNRANSVNSGIERCSAVQKSFNMEFVQYKEGIKKMKK